MYTCANLDNNPGTIVTVVVLSRLVYRKGIDLLTAIVPRICAAYPKVKFLIAGDGPKRVDLEQTRDEHLLHSRVELIGAVASEEARNVMVRGQIFLNTSLTEAFCMAILEAASCGLLVVSTKVGGIPEVLPPDMLILCEPDEDHLAKTLSHVIEAISRGEIDTSSFHQRISQMYSWSDVAARTEAVYLCSNSSIDRDTSLLARMGEYYGCGEMFGKIACFLVALDYIFLVLLEWLQPAKDIDSAPDFHYDSTSYGKLLETVLANNHC